VTSVSTGDLHGYHQTDTLNGIRFYGLHQLCCQTRGSYWTARDKGNCAMYGSDSFGGFQPWERKYCNDMMAENYWYYRALEAFTDQGLSGGGSGSLAVMPNFEKYQGTFKDS